ncbi:MAG: hypothetical protein LBE57_00155 [Methanosarcinales archaeon]|nr:hypothetical protein [Methanosarcinales archaeon]
MPTENSNVSIYLNDLEMIRFSESNSGTISIFGVNHSLVGTIQHVNLNVPYQNMTFNVLFEADLNELDVTIQKIEVGEIVDTFSYSFDFTESITDMRISVENYQSGVSFIEGEKVSAYHSDLPETPSKPVLGPDFITTYSYDSMDRIVQKTLPNGKVLIKFTTTKLCLNRFRELSTTLIIIL